MLGVFSKTQKLVGEGLVTIHGVNFTMGAMDVSVVQLVVTRSGCSMQKNSNMFGVLKVIYHCPL